MWFEFLKKKEQKRQKQNLCHCFEKANERETNISIHIWMYHSKFEWMDKRVDVYVPVYDDNVIMQHNAFWRPLVCD